VVERLWIIEVLGTKMLKRIDELEGLLNKRPAQDGLLKRNGRRVWKMMSDGDDAFRKDGEGLYTERSH
jgi:hypothetical protein